jgi:hypothetical protein
MISLHTESPQNEFLHMLSQCSNFGSFYMDIQTHAEPMRKRFHRLLNKETISLLAEHKGKRFHCWLSNFSKPYHANLYTVTSRDVNFCYPDRVPLTQFVHIAKKNYGMWA